MQALYVAFSATCQHLVDAFQSPLPIDLTIFLTISQGNQHHNSRRQLQEIIQDEALNSRIRIECFTDEPKDSRVNAIVDISSTSSKPKAAARHRITVEQPQGSPVAEEKRQVMDIGGTKGVALCGIFPPIGASSNCASAAPPCWFMVSGMQAEDRDTHDDDWFTTPVSQIVRPGSSLAEPPSQSFSAHGRVWGSVSLTPS